jgi:hypothetical protein
MADRSALGVFATVGKVGYPIQVLSSYDQEINEQICLSDDRMKDPPFR